MGDLSRQLSRQPLIEEDTRSLTSFTSFPDPSATSLIGRDGQEDGSETRQRPHEPLNGLLDRFGPSMFDDEGTKIASEAQTLSAAPAHTLRDIIDHHGVVELTRRLATLLAERDAHITALIRLAEEYKVPRECIVDAASRAKQAERRRLSLATASEDVTISNETMSDSGESTAPLRVENTIPSPKGFTRMFGGTGKRAKSTTPSLAEPSSPTNIAERSQSVDVRSVQSTESTNGWAANLFGTTKKRQDSISQTRAPREPLELTTQHDPEQLPPTFATVADSPQDGHWNKFMTRLREAREQTGEQAEGGELIGAAHFGQEGAAGQQKMKLLTRLIVGGIPFKRRHPIWMELSNTRETVQPGVYEHLLNSREIGDQSQIESIMKDVPRTLTSKYDFYTSKGSERLQDVLVAFVGKYQGLGYTQGLNTIAGYLLLAIPTAEDAFWVMCNIIENFYPPEYFSFSAHMRGPLADNIVLRQCVKELMPPLAKHMDALQIDPEHTVPLEWFFTAFSTVLPQEVLMRIWDVWLCLPAHKTFIFNVALVLLSQNTSALVKCETEGEYREHLDTCTKAMSEEPGLVDELMKRAFMIGKKLEQLEDRRNVEFKVMRRKRDSTEALYESLR